MTNNTHPSEDQEQEALFEWARMMAKVYPCLDMLFHIPNGGRRDAATGRALKRRGVKAGVPDICLPFPKGKYHGLYIELKVGKNKPSDAQRSWISRLDEQGYCAVVCYGWQSARDVITNYIDGGSMDNGKL